MEKFILLFRGSDVYEASQSPAALETLTTKMMDWVGGMIRKGQHLSSEKFCRSGWQISGQSSKPITDSFSTLKDIIGGCTIIQATDYEEAMAIATACPILSTNASIEVRQIQSV